MVYFYNVALLIVAIIFSRVSSGIPHISEIQTKPKDRVVVKFNKFAARVTACLTPGVEKKRLLFVILIGRKWAMKQSGIEWATDHYQGRILKQLEW